MCHYAIFTACRPKWISILGRARFSLSSIKLAKSYYDDLGVTPHATQSDIKAAYYKLSMQYHPDKSKDSEEAIKKFRSITEAYEVLGNFRLKKLYDKGLLHTEGSQYSNVAGVTVDDDETKFYKSRLKRDKPPPPTGRTPIYNYDEWSRAHYGQTFARQTRAKEMHNVKKAAKRLLIQEKETEKVMIGVVLVVLSFYFFAYVANGSYDTVDDLSGENENRDESGR